MTYSVRLTLVFIALAGFSTAAALIVQDRALKRDLTFVAQRRVATATRVTNTLLDLHLDGAYARYAAIAGTPQFRATLEIGDRPTLTHYAHTLALAQDASQVLFVDGENTILAVGEASAPVPARWPQEGAALVAHDAQPYVTVAIPLKTGERAVGRLVAFERLGDRTMAQWSELAGAEVLFGRVQSDRGDVIEASFTPDRGPPLTVRMSADSDVLANLRRNLIFAGLVALIGTILASTLASRRLVGAIHGIKAAAARIGTGDFAARVESERTDEFGDVARSINEMAARLEQLDFVQSILDGLPDAVMVLHRDGTIVRLNEQARLLGAARDGSWSELLDVGSRTRASKLLAEVAVGYSKRAWIETGLATGSTFHLWETVPLGQSLLVAGRDITDHKRSQQERARYVRESARLETEANALQRERELAELKSHFVSMASHEFRTPLATILAASDVLKRYGEKLTDEQRDGRLARIQSAVQHMTELVDQVLTLSRQRSGRMECAPQALDLDDFCKDVIRELAATVTETSRIVLESVHGSPQVDMDPRLMRQILGNLLENALKYSPDGGDVELFVVRDDESAVFRVRDYGIGISEDERKMLFEPFHRAASVESIPGTGLGLAIVKEAVELHGGTISVASELGAGTTFVVSIPNTAVSKEDDTAASA